MRKGKLSGSAGAASDPTGAVFRPRHVVTVEIVPTHLQQRESIAVRVEAPGADRVLLGIRRTKERDAATLLAARRGLPGWPQEARLHPEAIRVPQEPDPMDLQESWEPAEPQPGQDRPRQDRTRPHARVASGESVPEGTAASREWHTWCRETHL